jgi:hypothetical protein
MYCPTCGSEERQLSQYCRSCGTDLRSVRITLERPDAVTASAVSARDHISKAIADKIRETGSPDDLQKVAEDVLPEIEKFLESPEEKRLRRVRTGVIITFIGLGTVIGGLIASKHDESLFVVLMPALVTFFIGLAMVINGLMFTVPKKSLPTTEDQSGLPQDATVRAALNTADFTDTPQLTSTDRKATPVSITEHTTKHLADI